MYIKADRNIIREDVLNLMAYAFVRVFPSYFCKTHKGKWKRFHANMTIVHFNHAVALLAFEKEVRDGLMLPSGALSNSQP